MREGKGVWAVGERGGGIVVGFEEDAVDAGGYAGAGEGFDEFGLAAAGVALAARELDGMGDVVDDGVAEFCEDGESAHVHDQIVVAETGAAFGEDDFLIARSGDFFSDVVHVPRGKELSLLYVDDAAGFGGGYEEISLSRKEGGDLENVDDFGGGSGLGRVVNVGEDREMEIGFYFGEDAKAFGEAGTAESFYGGAIGFVVGGFEDVGYAGVGGDFGEALGHIAGVGFGFDYAGAGDEEEGMVAAEAESRERFLRVCVILRNNEDITGS